MSGHGRHTGRGFRHGEPGDREGALCHRGPATCRLPQGLCARQIRGHQRAVSHLPQRDRLPAFSLQSDPGHGMAFSRPGPGISPLRGGSAALAGGVLGLARCATLYRLAERQGPSGASGNRPRARSLSSAHRSGVGICRARRHHDGALVGRRHRHRPRQLQRLRQQVGQSLLGRRRRLRAQSLRAVRDAGQRLAMDRRLLARELRGRAR